MSNNNVSFFKRAGLRCLGRVPFVSKASTVLLLFGDILRLINPILQDFRVIYVAIRAIVKITWSVINVCDIPFNPICPPCNYQTIETYCSSLNLSNIIKENYQTGKSFNAYTTYFYIIKKKKMYTGFKFDAGFKS